MSDEDIASREGTWFSEKELIHPIIRSNIDVKIMIFNKMKMKFRI